MAKSRSKARSDPRPFGIHPGVSDRTGGFFVHTQKGAAGETIVSVQVNPTIFPEKSFFADYVHVKSGLDGVDLVFGKSEPLAATSEGAAPTLAAIVELSCPFRPFYNQIYKSILASGDAGKPPFIETVRVWAEDMGYPKLEPMGRPRTTAETRTASFRVNASVMALFEDDCAADFYHLDALAMRALMAGSRAGELSGVVRVTMSPGLMNYFLGSCVREAKALKERLPMVDAPPTPPKALPKKGDTDAVR